MLQYMQDTPSSRRAQINSELAARGANRRAKHVIEHHTPSDEQESLKIDFYCECSNPTCNKRIKLSLKDFERLHDNESQFVISRGHHTPQIEKVLKTRQHFQVVEKFML